MGQGELNFECERGKIIFLKNKKGFLLAEETLKIVIALISISVLVYFLFSLYSSNKDSKNLEFAKASLENLVESIENNVENVEIYNPDGWYVIFYPSDSNPSLLSLDRKVHGNFLPLSCSNLGWEICVCICKNKRDDDKNNNCDKKGICMKLNEQFGKGGNAQISKPFLKLKIDYESKQVVIVS